MFWFQKGLCILPVCVVVLSSSTFIFSYVIAVLRHDVNPLLPFISDTANNPPESCFFGLMTFISACTGIATIYAMYKYMAKLGQDTGAVSARCNRAALGLGLLSCLGMNIVATFQESAVQAVHLVGAMLFFICGTLYISIETYMSYRSYPYGSSLLDPLLQKISAGCEWTVALSIVSFFFTYIHDFKRFTLQVKTVCGSGE